MHAKTASRNSLEARAKVVIVYNNNLLISVCVPLPVHSGVSMSMRRGRIINGAIGQLMALVVPQVPAGQLHHSCIARVLNIRIPPRHCNEGTLV